jgi:hypothetical protein
MFWSLDNTKKDVTGNIYFLEWKDGKKEHDFIIPVLMISQINKF